MPPPDAEAESARVLQRILNQHHVIFSMRSVFRRQRPRSRTGVAAGGHAAGPSHALNVRNATVSLLALCYRRRRIRGPSPAWTTPLITKVIRAAAIAEGGDHVDV